MKRYGFRWAVVLTIVLMVGTLRGEAAETGYRPVVFAYRWEDAEEPALWLLGGFKDGAWYGHTDLPILVDGRPITSEEGIALSEPAVCSTPLLAKGKELAFYSGAAPKLGTGTVRETRYFCSAASAESFIEVETNGPSIPADTLCVAVDEGWDALTQPTLRTLEKERVIFAAGSDDARVATTFIPAVDEYGDAVYRGTIAYGDKTWPLTDAFANSPDYLEGLFIDLNGDGRVEFVLHAPGIAGFIAVWDLPAEGPKEVMTLDLGD